MFSLQHLTRLRSSQSQNFELDTISPTHSLTRRSGEQDRKAINHLLSSGNTVSPSKQRPAAHQNEQQGQSSESISLARSLRRASTNTTLSTRSAKRSTSWFKKYRFLPKLVDSDNPPLLWDFSKSQSKGTAIDKAKSNAQHDAPLHLDRYPQDASKAQNLADGGHEDEDGETSVLEAPETNVNVGPMPQGASSDSVQVVAASQETDKQHKWEQFQIRAKTSRAFGLQGTDSEASIDSQERKPVGELEHFTECFHNPLPEHSPPRSKRPSKTNSTDRTYATAASPEQRLPEPTQRSPMSSQTSTPTASVRLRLDGSPELGLSPPGTEAPRPKSPADPPQRRVSEMVVHPSLASAPVNASPKSVRRESKASNRSIKKIQVTIIFDGAEELVIDARLQRKNGSGDWRTLH